MAIQRENILGLIGSRRYHSAILTTFSFDFYFFEMKAMKWLRSCGVRNVNVLIDGHYYSELMQQVCGEEMNLSPGYSLYPVFNKSIFHPKIWMLFGEREALLILGSGNLTNAGNGNNEEIWGAFHFDVRATENALIFSAAWSYVQQLCSNVKGFTHEKTNRWILDHSKWLNELPVAQQTRFYNAAGGEKVAFLSNTTESSIWQQLSRLIGKEKVLEIITLSPYYDVKGKAIQALSKIFPSAKINVIIDEKGIVPLALPQSKSYLFYNWYNLGVSRTLHLKADNNGANSKLHAKIILFKTKTGKEFCLFGSANVTPEGLGLPGFTPNSEASLLIQSAEGGIINRLGIKLKTPTKLSEFITDGQSNIFDSIIKNNRYRVKLLSAEWVYDELYLYAEGDYRDNLKSKLFDREGRLLNTLNIGGFKIEMKTKLSVSLQESHYVQLFDAETDKPVSNKILLVDYYLLAKTHPNPKTEDIERIYNEIENGELSRVLDLLNYAILDDTESANSSSILANKSSRVTINNEKTGPDKLYDLDTYQLIEHLSAEKSLLMSSSSLRVLDIIKFTRSKGFAANTQPQLRDDEQESDLGNISGLDEQELTINRNISFAQLKSDRNKLHSYFSNLWNNQPSFFDSNETPKDYRPTLTDLSRYLIALELMLEYGGKTEKYVDENKEYFFDYLKFIGDPPYYNDNVKGICLNIVGDFLMLVRYGFKNYEFQYTKNKVQHLKSEALITSIVCLLNTYWKEDEMPYFNTLLLNCLHYLGDKNPAAFFAMWPELEKGITDKIDLLKHPSVMLIENLGWFKKRIIPAFSNAINQLEAKEFDTVSMKRQIIYKSPWGYCYVKDVTKQNEFTLSRPGFIWDNNVDDFIRHTNDEIYTPIKLHSFIQVSI